GSADDGPDIIGPAGRVIRRDEGPELFGAALSDADPDPGPATLHGGPSPGTRRDLHPDLLILVHQHRRPGNHDRRETILPARIPLPGMVGIAEDQVVRLAADPFGGEPLPLGRGERPGMLATPGE